MDESQKKKVASLLKKLSEEEIISMIKQIKAEKPDDVEKRKQMKLLARLKAKEAKMVESLTALREQIKSLEKSGIKVYSSVNEGSRGKGNVTGRPFEDLIVDVLRELNMPSRPRDIKAKILSNGWYDGSERSLNATISTVLKNLVETGRVGKNETKKYFTT